MERSAAGRPEELKKQPAPTPAAATAAAAAAAAMHAAAAVVVVVVAAAANIDSERPKQYRHAVQKLYGRCRLQRWTAAQAFTYGLRAGAAKLRLPVLF